MHPVTRCAARNGSTAVRRRRRITGRAGSQWLTLPNITKQGQQQQCRLLSSLVELPGSVIDEKAIPEKVSIPILTTDSAAPAPAPAVPITVTTTSRHDVLAATMSSEPCLIPLTVSDVHLRHEQLPFGYFFAETLDEQLLQESLSRVLAHFPVVAGRFLGDSYLAIQCVPSRDTLPLAFGKVNVTLQEWQNQVRGHSYKAGGGHPELLPLFDALLDNNNNNNNNNSGNLASVRVTYFEGGGTAIGVNFLHALGDTASCVHFVQCWSREMQQQAYPRGVSNIRASATCAGMMTEDLADLMGVAQKQQKQKEPSWFQNTWNNWFSTTTKLTTTSPEQDLIDTTQARSDKQQPSQEKANHEYLQLYFPPNVLRAMKTVGMAELAVLHLSQSQDSSSSPAFLSTNDMITAFGWLLKRSLSQFNNWNISMVVNLRGRCGVHAFRNSTGLVEEEADELTTSSATDQGLFGNGITNVVAYYPSTTSSFGVQEVTSAAWSIRKALQQGMLDMPDRLSQSRLGVTNHVSTASTFATTSWGTFSQNLWDISFSPNTTLLGFHGHPSHPIPSGKSTYASVIMNTCNGSVLYKLLLPSEQVEQAQQKHQELCQAFVQAAEQLQLQQQLQDDALPQSISNPSGLPLLPRAVEQDRIELQQIPIV